MTEPAELEAKLAEALEHVKNNRLVFMDVIVDGTNTFIRCIFAVVGMDEMVK